MKIKIVNYIDGEVRFVMEDDLKEGFSVIGGEITPKTGTRTYCIKLTDQTTQQQIIDKLKTMLPQEDTSEAIYNNLNLKSLEGTDI